MSKKTKIETQNLETSEEIKEVSNLEEEQISSSEQEKKVESKKKKEPNGTFRFNKFKK